MKRFMSIALAACVASACAAPSAATKPGPPPGTTDDSAYYSGRLATDGVSALYTLGDSIMKIPLSGDVHTPTKIAELPTFTNGSLTPGTGIINPMGFAVDPAGHLYTLDGMACSVVKILPDGTESVLATLAKGNDCGYSGNIAYANEQPLALQVDPQGNVDVLDWYSKFQDISGVTYIDSRVRVTKITPSGSKSTVFDWSDSYLMKTPAPAFRTFAIARDGTYFAATFTAVYKFSASSMPTTAFAGSAQSGTADGVGAAASFTQIRGLVTDGDRNVFVADQGAAKIRRIDASTAEVTTIAGGGTGESDGGGSNAGLAVPYSIVWVGSGTVDAGTLYVDGVASIRKIDVGYSSVSAFTSSTDDHETCGATRCSSSGYCATSAGAPACACKDGFVGDGVTCRRPCSISNGGCSPDATCTESTDGATGSCACPAKLEGDGLTCEPGIGAKSIALSGGNVVVTFTGGVPNASYDVEASTDLSTWSLAGTSTADESGVFTFEDTPAQPVRFYRGLMSSQCPPGEMRVANACASVVSVAEGLTQTCAATSAGNVRCWGTGQSRVAAFPEDVPGLTNVIAVAGGTNHMCALTSSGGVTCWGANDHGQLGDGATTATDDPVDDVVGLGSGVAKIAAGGDTTCAVLASGGVDCWGRNDLHQLGDGTTTDRTTPVAVPNLSGVTMISVSVGAKSACAVGTNESMHCWGLVLGKTATSKPSSIASNVLGVAVARDSICYVGSNHKLVCGGANDNGEVGSGNTGATTLGTSPSGLGTVSSVTAGADHFCAITTSGATMCWGRNDEGELGDGTRWQRMLPAVVPGSSPAAIVGGERSTCAILSSGGLQCWGKNDVGQVGDGTILDRLEPTFVSSRGSGVSP